MKINFIMSGLGDSGGMKVVRRYAEELDKLGNEVVIYCPMIAYNLHRYGSSVKNYIHKAYCTGKILIQKKNNRLVRWIWHVSDKSVGNADVTIATSWPTAFDVAKLNDSKGKKFYFIQGFEIWDNRELGLKSYKLPLNKVVISSWINEQFKIELGIGPFPVVINGIDTSMFYDQHIRDDEDRVFLMLNHTLKIKGVENGLKVFNKIREKYPDAILKMFGMCDNSNLPDYVEYYQNPSKEVLTNLYCTSNYFIFPSLEEGWGLTPIEAMACGCVIVGTNTGFVLDLGKHRENMMISEPGDVEQMVSNVTELLNDNELFKSIQTNLKNTVEKFDWETSCSELLKLLSIEDNHG